MRLTRISLIVISFILLSVFIGSITGATAQISCTTCPKYQGGNANLGSCGQDPAWICDASCNPINLNPSGTYPGTFSCDAMDRCAVSTCNGNQRGVWDYYMSTSDGSCQPYFLVLDNCPGGCVGGACVCAALNAFCGAGCCAGLWCDTDANRCCPSGQYYYCSSCVSPIAQNGVCNPTCNNVCGGAQTCVSLGGANGRCCPTGMYWDCFRNTCTWGIAQGQQCTPSCASNSCSGASTCVSDGAGSGRCCPTGQQWCAATGTCTTSCAVCGNNIREGAELCDFGAGNAASTLYRGGSSTTCGPDTEEVCNAGCSLWRTVANGLLDNYDNAGAWGPGDRCTGFCSGKRVIKRDCFMSSVNGALQCVETTITNCANNCNPATGTCGGFACYRGFA